MGNTQTVQTVRDRRNEKAIASIVRQTNAGNTIHVNEVKNVTIPAIEQTELPKVSGVLYFTVLEARLDEKVAAGCSEDSTIAPYINVKVGDKLFETRVVEKLNPVWNQQYHIYLNGSLFEPILIELMSMSTFTRFTKLGETEVKACDVVKDTEEHDVWLNITKLQDKRRRKFAFKKVNLNVAEVHITYRFKPIDDIQYDFWTRLANQYDFDHNGEIDPFELGCMLQAIGSTLSDYETEQLLSNGPIPISDLPAHMKKTKVQHLVRVTNCPVCGDSTVAQRTNFISKRDCVEGKVSHASVQPSCVTARTPIKTDLEVIAHIGPCMESHCGEEMLIRNFLFDLVGISWWKERLTEWKAHVQYLRDNGNMAVFDRQTGKWMEEKIPVFSKLAARALYSALPKHPENAKQFLCKLTTIVAPKYDDPMTRKFIPQFIHFYGINMDDVRDPVTSFKTFNEFFYRRFKPHSRPIADPRNHRIAVMPADGRVVVFNSISESTKFWVKGEGFNLKDFLQDEALAKKYKNGSMAICRLAPEDIHRYVVPATCKVGESKVIPGEYFPAIPVVMKENVDVLTNNVRVITPLRKTSFGDILFVSVGSTMIGSVQIVAEPGTILKKGDELGYFKFGGSTIVLLFEPEKVVFAEDLEQQTSKMVETYCWLGSPLGVVRSKI